jgi:CelD/BcsL family acetyltransferase involved in cellulose biosynthesis
VSSAVSVAWQLIRDREGFAQLETRWRALETQWQGGTPFQSFAWCHQWLTHRGKSYTPYVLVRTDHRLIAPFAMTVIGGTRVLRLTGMGDSDYLGLVTSMPPGDAWGAVISELYERKTQWHLLHLQSIKQKADVLSALRQHEGIAVLERDYETCPNLPIRGTWEAYLNQRKKVKYESRRWAKRVKEFGTVTVESVAPPLPPDLMREMIEVEQDSWKWELGTAALKPGEQADFVCAILQDPRMPVRVWCLRTNAKLVAFAVVFEDQESWYYYLPSFRKHCPNAGAHLLSCIVEDAFRQGRGSVDLLQGDHGYKSLWTDEAVGVAEILAAHSLRGRMVLWGYRTRWRASNNDMLRRLRNVLRNVGDRRETNHVA